MVIWLCGWCNYTCRDSHCLREHVCQKLDGEKNGSTRCKDIHCTNTANMCVATQTPSDASWRAPATHFPIWDEVHSTGYSLTYKTDSVGWCPFAIKLSANWSTDCKNDELVINGFRASFRMRWDLESCKKGGDNINVEMLWNYVMDALMFFLSQMNELWCNTLLIAENLAALDLVFKFVKIKLKQKYVGIN